MIFFQTSALEILILLRLKIPLIFSGGLEGIQKQHKHQDGDRGSTIVTLYMPLKGLSKYEAERVGSKITQMCPHSY